MILFFSFFLFHTLFWLQRANNSNFSSSSLRPGLAIGIYWKPNTINRPQGRELRWQGFCGLRSKKYNYFSLPVLCCMLADCNKYKGDIFIFSPSLTHKTAPFPADVSERDVSGDFKSAGRREKTIRFIAIPIPSDHHATVLATDHTVNSEIGSLFSWRNLRWLTKNF